LQWTIFCLARVPNSLDQRATGPDQGEQGRRRMPLDESRDSVTRMLAEVDVKTGWGDQQETLLNQWFKDFKDWEQKEEFETAFDDDRMTIRATSYATGSFQRGAAIKEWEKDPTISASKKKGGITDDYVIKSGAVSQFPTIEGRPMRLAQGVKGIMDRGKPENFDPTLKLKEPPRDLRKKVDPNAMPVGWTKKYWLGLHDLSAILLKHDRPDGPDRWAIETQVKFYNEAVWTFMPVPLQEDLILFNRLNSVAKEQGASEKLRQYVRMIASQMTRIGGAQAEDMHTTYTDIGGLRALNPNRICGKIKYGIGGYGVGGWSEVEAERKLASPEQIALRKTYALQYKTMLKELVAGTACEIVMKYRIHGNGKTMFPIFATQAKEGEGYNVIDKVTAKATNIQIKDGKLVQVG
jgi:hypothetical protein